MTRTSRSRARSLVASFIALGLVTAACGGDDDDADDVPAPAEEPTADEPATEEPATEEPATEEPAAEEPAAEEPAAEEPAAEEPKEDITLTMGGSAASSSVFAFLAAHTRLMGDADGAMTINVRETGASVENIQLVEEGATEFGLSALSVLIQAHRGINTFEGEAFPNHCNLLNYLNNGEFMVVHEDIESVYDLDGKSFAPGFQGSATFDNHMAYLEALGIEVDVFDGSLEDIVNAMKDGRIVGFTKSANGFTADATMLDVASSVPVKVIGFTQEDVDKIMAADPVNEVLYVFTEIEEGAIFDNEKTFVSSILASYFTSTEVTDEDTQYRLTKAAWDAIDEAAEQASYAGSANRTIEETLSTADIMPLCPGAQRYYDEVS